MSKRKRSPSLDTSSTTAAPPPAILSARQHRLTHKLSQPVHTLVSALKLAKGFERQKLGRRFKTAISEGAAPQPRPEEEDQEDGERPRRKKRVPERERVEKEISALKGLDLVVVARRVLGKKVWGIKGVREKFEGEGGLDFLGPGKNGESVLGGVLILGVGGVDGERKEELNVVARLVSSAPVGKVMDGCVRECLAALGVRDEMVKEGGKKKRLRKKDFEETNKGVVDTGGGGASLTASKRQAKENGRDAAEDEDSNDEFAQFNNRLASSGDEDEDGDVAMGSNEDDIEDLERQLELEGIQRINSNGTSGRPKYDPMDDLSPSDADENDDDYLSTSSTPRKLASSSSKRTSAVPVAKANKSSFLPSLSLGGYISGSDSEGIDDEIDVAPRKNRPGQRARQQIWEKKYGTKAKHLQKADRNSGWDAKRGATSGSDRRSGGKFQKGTFLDRGAKGKGGAGKSTEPDVEKKKHRDDAGSIHPSWEAAKRAKEKREAPVAFQGKKVVFD